MSCGEKTSAQVVHLHLVLPDVGSNQQEEAQRLGEPGRHTYLHILLITRQARHSCEWPPSAPSLAASNYEARTLLPVELEVDGYGYRA